MEGNQPVSLACIIDDDDNYRFVLERMFHLFHLSEKTITFSHGGEALNYLSGCQDLQSPVPDVIFLDINMPVINGWKFLEGYEHIREKLGRQIPIFMVSSSVEYEDIRKAKSYSTVRDYLVKPVTKMTLTRVMEQLQKLKVGIL